MLVTFPVRGDLPDPHELAELERQQEAEPGAEQVHLGHAAQAQTGVRDEHREPGPGGRRG